LLSEPVSEENPLTFTAATPFQKLKDYLRQMLPWIAVSIVLGSLAILWVGENPIRVYGLLVREGFFTKRGFMIAIQRGTPLILTASAATMAFKAGAINMGMAGQFMVGGTAASMAAAAFAGLPKLIHLPLVLFFCALGGAAAGFVPAFFKRVSGINEVITGMIANLMMPHLLSAVVNLLPLLRSARFAARRGIPETAQFRHFSELTNGVLGVGTKANTSVFMAIALAFFLSWWIRRSTLGFEIRMTKANYTFAEFVGIRASRGFYLGMMLSGAIAALAGATEVLGTWQGYRTGTLVVGEKGLVISLIGAQNFIGSMVVALIYGGLESGTLNVSWFTSIPRPLIDIIVLLIFILSAVPAMRSFFTGSDPAESEHLGGQFVTRWR
jgi:ABC-type uncharacterized transport system permease subunit